MRLRARPRTYFYEVLENPEFDAAPEATTLGDEKTPLGEAVLREEIQTEDSAQQPLPLSKPTLIAGAHCIPPQLYDPPTPHSGTNSRARRGMDVLQSRSRQRNAASIAHGNGRGVHRLTASFLIQEGDIGIQTGGLGLEAFFQGFGIHPQRLPSLQHEVFGQGWYIHRLLNNSVYFSHTSLPVVTDVDLRAGDALERVHRYLHDADPPPHGWEFWIRGMSDVDDFIAPDCVWVHHGKREVSAVIPQPLLEASPAVLGCLHDADVDMARKYWSFVESHPLHMCLSERARVDAMNILWSLYRNPSSPFTRDECQELMNILDSFNEEYALKARTIARIFLRDCMEFRQYEKNSTPPTPHREWRAFWPERRSVELFVVALTIGILAIILPYLWVAPHAAHCVEQQV